VRLPVGLNVYTYTAVSPWKDIAIQCIYIYIYIYTHIYIYLYYIYIYIYIYIYCTLAYISKSQIILSQLNCLNWPFRNHNTNLVLYPCLSFSYLYIDIYLCVCVCVYVYVYVYIYIYTRTHICIYTYYTIRERSFGMILVLLLQITWARTLLSNFDYCFSSYNSTVLPMFHCRYLICFTCVLTVFN